MTTTTHRTNRRPPDRKPRVPRAAALATLLGAGLFLASCGYTASPALLPSHLKSVSIPTFENGTTEYTLEQDITQAVIARFVRDNHLKVVDEKAADCVVRAKITQYKNSVFGFTNTAESSEYRVTIAVQVVFKDLVKNREIWNDEIIRTANYYVQNVPGQTAKTELDGRREAVSKIADEILNRSVEGW